MLIFLKTMPVIWCANVSAHHHKSKVGQKPSFPKGQRRINKNLADFLTYTSSISFDENDFLCTTCFESAMDKLNNLHPVNPCASTGTEPPLTERNAARAALSTISNLTYVGLLNINDEDLSSDHWDEDISNLKSCLNKEESLDLLNNVLMLTNESPIKDLRNSNIVNEKIEKTIRVIRDTKEKLFIQTEKQDNFDMANKTKLTMAELDEFIVNFQFLIEQTDYSEKIRLLTLVPKHWGRTKIMNFFSCSEHQARYSIYLRDAGQILCSPIDLRGNLPFNPATEKAIFDFFHDDEISRV